MEKPLDQFDFEDFWPDKSAKDVVAARFYSVFEANLAASRLRSEGFPCFIANEHTNTIMPELIDYVSLHVRPTDMENVRVLLADMNPDWVVDSTAFDYKNGFNFVHAATIAIAVVLLMIFLYAVSAAF